MGDLLEVETVQGLRERRLVGKVDLDEPEGVAIFRFQERKAIALQLDAVIIAEAIDADDRRAALEQPPAQMKADEAGCSRHQNGHYLVARTDGRPLAPALDPDQPACASFVTCNGCTRPLSGQIVGLCGQNFPK